MEIKSILGNAFFITFILFGIGCLCFWIWTIIDCAKKENDDQNKLIWLLIIVLLSVIGSCLYFFVRRSEQLKDYDKNLAINRKAITSLILGCCGFWFLGFAILLNPISIILGHISRREIKQGNSRGADIALAGLIMGYLPFIFLLLFIIRVY